MTSVEMVRGEMWTWSDLTADVAPAGGPLLERLVETIVPSGARVVIVGPHDLAFIDHVVRRAATCTVIVRSASDAEAIATEFVDRGVRIVCGDVRAVEVAELADVVVALDGLERTVSIEADAPTWRDVFDHVRAMVGPSGAVAVAIDNPLSVDELAATPARGGSDGNADWRVDELRDDSRPHTSAAATGIVPGASILTAFPSARAATLLAHSPSALSPALVVAHTPRGGRPDRRETMRTAITAGRLVDFAPSWILLVGAPIVSDALVMVASGAIEVPTSSTGTLLESALLDACRARDATRVRRLAAAFVDALRTEAGLEPWQAITADNVAIDETGRFELLDASATGGGATSLDDAVSRCFGDFADRLFELGWRHPWPVAFGADEVGRTLTSMGDIDPGPPLVRRREPGGEQRPDAASLSAINEALRSQLAWFESTLDVRQRELAALRDGTGAAGTTAAERDLAVLEASAALRIGRAVLRPVRGLRLARTALRRRLRR